MSTAANKSDHRNKLTTRRQWLLSLAAVGGIAGGAWFMRRFAALTPETVMQTLFDMNAPTRFVFVSDAASVNVAIIDILSREQVATLTLDVHPDLWSLGSRSGLLIYTAQDEPQLWLREVTTHNTVAIALPHRVETWQISDTTGRAIVVGDGQLSICDTANKRLLHTYPIEPAKSLWLDERSDRLWWLANDKPALGVRSLADGSTQTYELPPTWRNIAPLSATPDGQYLLLNADDEQDAVLALWDVVADALHHRQSYAADSAPIRAYSNAAGSKVWAMTQQGQGIDLDIDNPAHHRPLTANVGQVNALASAWLDTRLLIVGSQGVDVLIANDLTAVKHIDLPTIRDLFITADSKTALLTADGDAALYLLSARNGELQRLALHDIAQPQHVIMGASATLCH